MSSYPSQPIEVGFDLQTTVRVVLEELPPGPVDVIVSAPPGSGVLFSASRTEVGSESLVVGHWFHQHSRPRRFYVQGTIQGDDVDDDVPITIDVFDTGTTNPGRLRTDRTTHLRRCRTLRASPSPPATTSTAPTFPDTDVPVYSYLLYDGESGTLHDRSGTTRRCAVATPSPSTRPTATPRSGVIVTPAVFTGGTDDISGTRYGTNAIFDGLTAGNHRPGDHPTVRPHRSRHRPTTRTVNVTAPDVYLSVFCVVLSVPADRGGIRSPRQRAGRAGGTAAGSSRSDRVGAAGVGSAVLGIPQRGRF